MTELKVKWIAQRKGISVDAVAAVWGVRRHTAAQKLEGAAPITIAEAFRLRDALFPEYTLELLFSPAGAAEGPEPAERA